MTLNKKTMARATKKYNNEFLICNEYHGRRAIETLSELEDILEKHNIDVNQLDNILTEYAEYKKIKKDLEVLEIIKEISDVYESKDGIEIRTVMYWDKDKLNKLKEWLKEEEAADEKEN